MIVQYSGELATKYSSDERFTHPQNFLPYDAWLREVGSVMGVSTLDLACGHGVSSRFLAESGARVTGVDISPELIEVARARERVKPLGITYEVGDASCLDLRDKEGNVRLFRLVTPSFLFHYADSKEVLAAFVESVAKHLAPGGRMVALHASVDPIVPQLANASHWSEWVEGEVPYREGARVRLHLCRGTGEEVCHFTYHYWSSETYVHHLARAGLVGIRWVPLRATEALKRYPNWCELEQHNASVILTAHKPL